MVAASHTGCVTAVAAFQPENLGGETIVLSTMGSDGKSYERVLSPIDDNGQLVVSSEPGLGLSVNDATAAKWRVG